MRAGAISCSAGATCGPSARRRLHGQSPAAKARAEFDLAITSVLLDAGAGPAWRYLDPATEQVVTRSEGLGVASLRMFEAGAFSADPRRSAARRRRAADASESRRRRARLSEHGGQSAWSASKAAPRCSRASARRSRQRRRCSRGRTARGPAAFTIISRRRREDGRLPAPRILEALLVHLGPIWPSRLTLGGVPLGDTWRHPAIKRADATDGLVPIHKLSQWLAYSLIEPLQLVRHRR